MILWLALPDGTIVDAIMREDESSGDYTSIVQWRIVEPTADEEMSLASRITTNAELATAFSKAVQHYYDFRILLR